MSNQITQEIILKTIGDIKEPALNKSLVSAMLVRDIEIKKDEVSLTLVMLSYIHPHQESIESEITEKLQSLDGVKKVKINTIVEVPVDGRLRASGPLQIKNVIAVASGKGGVGKSTVAVNLAVSLARAGAKVGLMDADVYGPNIPRMMGLEKLPPPPANSNRILPGEAHGVKLISIGFMVQPEQPIIWRGPMLHGAIRQFLLDVDWGELDYLIIDLPPGTGDAQLSLAQTISVTGGLIITLPQEVSLEDARRGLEMFRQLKIPILGVVENMSYLELPDGQKMDVFGTGGGKSLAEERGVDYIGDIPLDPAVRISGDDGTPIVVSNPDSTVAKALHEIAAEAALRAAVIAVRNQSQSIPINIVN